jgi:hypothetical protein
MHDSTNTTDRASQTRVLKLESGKWDRLGVLLSGLCLVHCLLLPAAVLLLPRFVLLETVHDIVHPVLLLLILPVTLVALRHRSHCTTTHHGARTEARLLLGGLALIGLAWPAHVLLGPAVEIGMTVVGGIGLVTGHLRHLASPPIA